MKLKPAKPFHQDLLTPIRMGETYDFKAADRFLQDSDTLIAKDREHQRTEIIRKRALLAEHYGVPSSDAQSLLDAVLGDLLPGFRVVPFDYGRGRPPEWDDRDYMLLVASVEEIKQRTGKSILQAIREFRRTRRIRKFTVGTLEQRYFKGLDPEHNGFIGAINDAVKKGKVELLPMVLEYGRYLWAAEDEHRARDRESIDRGGSNTH